MSAEIDPRRLQVVRMPLDFSFHTPGELFAGPARRSFHIACFRNRRED
jgi:hypothetical protein